jgi:hypothetical protein
VISDVTLEQSSRAPFALDPNMVIQEGSHEFANAIGSASFGPLGGGIGAKFHLCKQMRCMLSRLIGRKSFRRSQYQSAVRRTTSTSAWTILNYPR